MQVPRYNKNIECLVDISALGIRPFSAGIHFRRQIMTSKVDPRTERVKYLLWP